MQEINITLRFITPCLGNVRRTEGCDLFERDVNSPGQPVVFQQSWFRSLFTYGAQAYGRHQNTILNARVYPHVQGTPGVYRRYYGQGQYTDHEAFLTGDCITLKVMLPDGISEIDFREIMRLAGGYKGLSPYKWQEGYGRFTVV